MINQYAILGYYPNDSERPNVEVLDMDNDIEELKRTIKEIQKREKKNKIEIVIEGIYRIEKVE